MYTVAPSLQYLHGLISVVVDMCMCMHDHALHMDAHMQAVSEASKLRYQVMHLKRAVNEADQKLAAK